jgi:hypothetical protein
MIIEKDELGHYIIVLVGFLFVLFIKFSVMVGG